MYEVKEYFDGYRLYYGVYIKTKRNMYDLPPNERDNLIVLCVNEEHAEKIKEILEADSKIEEYMNDNDI